jgi:hypothetical protein
MGALGAMVTVTCTPVAHVCTATLQVGACTRVRAAVYTKSGYKNAMDISCGHDGKIIKNVQDHGYTIQYYLHYQLLLSMVPFSIYGRGSPQS